MKALQPKDIPLLFASVCVAILALVQFREINHRKVALAEISDIYNDTLRSITLIEHRLFTIMDTEIRILHYATPHKGPVLGCPECVKVVLETDERQKDEEFVPEKN